MPSAPTDQERGARANPPAGGSPLQRINLEERLAWLERHIVEQDKEMLVLHDALVRLRRELAALRSASTPRNDRDDAPAAGETEPRPPHY